MRATSASFEQRHHGVTHVGAVGTGAEKVVGVMMVGAAIGGGVGTWIGYKVIGGWMGAATGAYIGVFGGFIASMFVPNSFYEPKPAGQ